MVRKLRPRSAYDVMAAIAFFIAVAGGSAYAAATIGSGKIKNDAVLSRHIKNGEVKNPDLAANSVGSGKVINNSLTGADIKAATLGQVPSAGHAGTAAQATSTAHANNSDRLGDSLPSAFFPAANVTKIDKDAAGCTTAADPGCSMSLLAVWTHRYEPSSMPSCDRCARTSERRFYWSRTIWMSTLNSATE